MRRKLPFALLALAALCLAAGCEEPPKSPPPPAPPSALPAAPPSVLPAAPLLAKAGGGVSFETGGWEEVLQVAAAKKQNILVEFWATWCPPCKKQKKEIFDTEVGARLTQELVAWRVDFDAPAGQALVKRWNILSLPTVLFFRPDGAEIDRIEGYEEQEEFLREARRLGAGEDPLPGLLSQWKAAESAPALTRLPLQVDIGHRKLVRGEVEEGRRLLESAAAEGLKSAGEGKIAGQDALFFLGRYESRVRRDFMAGAKVWRRLHDAYPKGKYEGTAAWWHAGALHELKEDDQAVSFLASRCGDKPDEPCLDLLVSFAEKHGAGVEKARALFAAASLEEKHKAELSARLAKLTKGSGS